MFVDDFGDFGVLVAFAVDNVAPMAPDRADIEEDGLVFGLGASESGVAPFVPVDGLVGGGAQIRAGGIFQAVFRMTAQACPYTSGEQAPALQKHPPIGTTKTTGWCRRGRDRLGRAVCGWRILRPGDGKSGCGPRRAS